MGDRVFVVAGGPSLKDFDFNLLKDEDTITINKSIFHVPNPKFFISVDYTFLRKVDHAKFNGIKTVKAFVADFSYPFLVEKDGRIVDMRFNLVYALGDYNLIIKSYKQDGIGFTFDDFRTGRNSGFCGLQLAVVLGYKKIYLLGMDLNTSGATSHFHGGYGESIDKFDQKLSTYYDYFKSGIKSIRKDSNISIISCSNISRLNGLIPYINISEVL